MRVKRNSHPIQMRVSLRTVQPRIPFSGKWRYADPRPAGARFQHDKANAASTYACQIVQVTAPPAVPDALFPY